MKKFFKWLGDNYTTIVSVLFTLQIANFLLVYLFKKSFLIFNIALFFLIFITFGIGKDFIKEKSKKTSFFVLKISTLIFIFSLINHFVIYIALKFDSPEKMNSFFNLSYLINLAIVIALFSICRSDWYKKGTKNFYEKSILNKINIQNKDENNKGDIKLCTDKNTKKPVIIPLKDRYLHMLILGPTGCGKTSQIILPMINQDMQNIDCGLTVIEPKSDLAEKVYAMALHYNRKAVYFNPILPNCPYFNPLYGKEDDVIENMVTTFKMLNSDSPQFFMDMNENLARNGLKVLKRLYGNKSTLVDFARLIQDTGGIGKKMVMNFSKLNSKTEAMAKENADISSWFLTDYFKDNSKTYEHCSGLRSQVAKIISNEYLRKVLNPPDGLNDVDFEKHLEEGGVIAIATPQGKLGLDLSRFLGYFIILQFQSAVFKRPGTEDTRKAHFLYIDEFQAYSNPGFANMLTQGRSYRVASHLATQNRALMAMGGGKDGKNFVELVSTNARNVVIFPGGNAIDAKYYSDQFGQELKTIIRKGSSRTKFNPLYGFHRLNYPNENINKEEKMEARFSASDIMYKEFKEITYGIIKNSTLQPPGVGVVDFIPEELNDKLSEMVKEFQDNDFIINESESVSQEDLIDISKNIDVIEDTKNNDETNENIIDPISQIDIPKIVTEPQKKPEKTENETIDSNDCILEFDDEDELI